MSVKSVKQIDLKAEVCPYTFVRSKLALEDLAGGETLEIILGNSESASNVPRSLEGEGHEILSLEKPSPATWRILVRKRSG